MERTKGKTIPKNVIPSVLRAIEDLTGTDLNAYRQKSLVRGIQGRLEECKIDDSKAYLSRLKSEPAELELLKKEIRYNKGSFFQDDSLRIIAKKVLPTLIENKLDGETLRIWVPSCGNGQEAYSMAIMLLEVERITGTPNPNIRIFASDISEDALQVAIDGNYPESIKSDLDEELLKRYFKKSAKGWTVKSNIRNLIQFNWHDLLIDLPISNVDLIICRNLISKLRPKAAKKLRATFSGSLAKSGYLLLGRHEKLPQSKKQDSFQIIDPSWGIFLHKKDSQGVNSILENSVFDPKKGDSLRERIKRKREEDVIKQALLDKYSKPTVFVNKDFKIAYLYGDLSEFINLDNNSLHLDLIKMLPSGLAAALRNAVHKVNQTEESFTDEVMVKKGRSHLSVQLSVEIFESDQHAENLFMVTMEKLSLQANQAVKQHPKEITGSDQIRALRTELLNTRESLHATITEMEEANEELLAINEMLFERGEKLQLSQEELGTSNKKLKEGKYEAELLLQTKEVLLDRPHFGSIILDNKLNISNYSNAATEIFRMRKRDIGRPLAEITLDFDYPELAKDAQKVFSSKKSIIKLVKGASGKWYSFRIQHFQRSKMKLRGVVITFFDVTEIQTKIVEHRAITRSLESRNAQLNAIFRTLPDFFFVFNNDGIFIDFFVNQKEDLIFPPQDFLGKEISSIFPNAAAGRLHRAINSVLTTREFRNMEFNIFMGGKKHFYEARILPLKSDQVIALIRDITELKKTQRELSRRVRQLDTANSKLERYIESNLELEKFAHVASHDLREPIRNISMFAQLLQRRGQNVLNKELEEYILHIQRSSSQMQHLVDSLLNYSKVNSANLQLEGVDLGDLVGQVVHNLQASIQENKATIKVGKLPLLNADKTRLTQVFQNLISNAIKFRRKVKPKIDIKCESKSDFFQFSVSDNGLGIEEQYFDKIFLTFKQLNNKENFGGAGIGLSLCKKSVESMGGEIWVESTVGKGSKFNFTLPRSAELKSLPKIDL